MQRKKSFQIIVVFVILILVLAIMCIICSYNKSETISSNYKAVIIEENPEYQLAVLTVKNSFDEPQVVWCEIQSSNDGSNNAFVGRIDFWSRGSKIEFIIEGDILFGGENYIMSTVNTCEEYSYFVFNSDCITASGSNIYQHGFIEAQKIVA